MGKVDEFTLPIPGFSQSPRRIWVYLPNHYDECHKKFDVLYMFDGHNLFYDKTATYGKSWGLKTYLDEADADLVVIGQDCNHSGNRRLAEYCPFPQEKTYLEDLPKIHPKGRKTADWFVHELKPYCEAHYHITRDRKHTGIGGSSMGGLMAEYMAAAYNDIYGLAACVSPSTHFNYNSLMKLIGQSAFKKTKIYIDQGSQEVHGKRRFIDEMDIMLNINHAFSERGCVTYPHLTPGGHHTEADWEKVLPVFLPWLFPDAFTK